MHQIDLIPWNEITPARYQQIVRNIRTSYWYIRNLRGGKFGQARARKEYRKVEALKGELFLAGYEKRYILDLLACCRGTCIATKSPFPYCIHCGAGRVDKQVQRIEQRTSGSVASNASIRN